MKIRIIGYAGSGKTTLSRKMEEELQLKSISLDSFLKHKDKEQRQELFEKHLANFDSWIVEGVQFQKWCEKSFLEADVIILLDYPLYLCQYRVLKRSFLGHFGETTKKRRTFLRKRARSLLKWNKKFSERLPKLKKQIMQRNSNLHIMKTPKDLSRVATIVSYYQK